MAAKFEEDTEWREDDGQDDIYERSCSFLHVCNPCTHTLELQIEKHNTANEENW